MSIAAGTQGIDAVVNNLASMLSACASFQNLTQAADAAEALGSIYAYRVAGTVARPYAVILDESVAQRRIAEGCSVMSGRLIAQIEVNVAETAALTAVTDAANFTASGLSAYANDHFNAQTLTIQTGAMIGETGEVQDFVGATGAIALTSDLPDTPEVGDAILIAPTDVQDEHRAFTKTIDAIIADMWALDAAGAGYLLLRDISREWGQPNETMEAGYFGANIMVEWGLG